MQDIYWGTAKSVYICVRVLTLCVFMSPLFQDHRFSDEIDKLTGYKTQSILCMAICNSDGEVIGVVQAINKNPMGTPFTEDDEKVRPYYVSQLKIIRSMLTEGFHSQVHFIDYFLGIVVVGLAIKGILEIELHTVRSPHTTTTTTLTLLLQ